MALPNEARPRRLIPRYPFSQRVSVQGQGVAVRSYLARDVSVGGFFLATDDPFELFCDLTLEVCLPSGERISLRARVVHLLTPDKARSVGVPAGIGVQFEGLRDPELSHVRALVAWARANDPRARIAQKKPDADLGALRDQPMLSYLFDHVDGKRDPEALADELGIEPGSVERMQRELVKLGVVELIAANGQLPSSPQTTPEMTPATKLHEPLGPAKLTPLQAEALAALEKRLGRSNHYSALDVPESANTDVIRARFQALDAELRRWTAGPDHAARVEHVHNQLREAFGVLSSAPKRGEYDQYLARGRELEQAQAERAKRTEGSPPARALGPRAPSPPSAAAVRAHSAARPRATGARAAAEQAPLGAAAQILVQAEQAHAAGRLAEAGKHLQLLTAMSFDDAKIRARVAQLRTQVSRALAVDFEKQAAYEEKQQRWALAARSWLRVAEGRPKDSLPLQRAALAQLQVPGVDLKQVLELAKRAVALSGGDAEAHRTLARVYVAAGMQANARRALEAAQRCDAPVPAAATGEAAPKDRPERGLFKRLLGRDAPN